MNREYELVAEQYQKLHTLPIVLYVDSFSYFKTLGDLTDKSILDLGCGAGFYSRQFKKKEAKKVIGVELSEQMIHLAREAEKNEPLGIEYLVQDVTSLGNLGSFDLVTASYLLNHAPSREQLLLMCQAIASNLKPNGRFVGLNNNIFQAPSSYQTSVKYGLSKSIQGELVEGCPITVTFQVPNSNQTFSVTDYYLSEATYQWAFTCIWTIRT